MFFWQLYWEKSKHDTLWRRHFWIPPLDLFRKFIRFGAATLPYYLKSSVRWYRHLWWSCFFIKNMQSWVDLCLPLSIPHPPFMIEEEDWDRKVLREGWRYQIRWIFGKVPNGSWPPPPLLRMVPISGNHVQCTLCMHFILFSHHISSHTCNHICHKKFAI